MARPPDMIVGQKRRIRRKTTHDHGEARERFPAGLD
jgi:hypothetical protein